MKKSPTPFNENPKRAAFKRFSQMSAAGLAVLSFSAFADVSAKQLPANVENSFVQERNSTLVNRLTNRSFAIENEMFAHSESSMESPHNLYSNYVNTYSNTYSDTGYTNNYSNYCDITII